MNEQTDQPAPVPRPGVPSVQATVRADLEQRERVGVQRYGTPLQPHNGRDGLRDAYEEAMDLTCYLKQVLIERDDSKGEAVELAMTLAAITGDRDALDDSLNHIREALGVPADTAWRTKAILEAIRTMLGQLERARRMLVNHDYDVDTHDMDGGLRAALADLRSKGERRVDGDLLKGIILDACPPWMADPACNELAEQILASCARSDEMTVVRGPNGELWAPEPVVEARVCCEPAS